MHCTSSSKWLSLPKYMTLINELIAIVPTTHFVRAQTTTNFTTIHISIVAAATFKATRRQGQVATSIVARPTRRLIVGVVGRRRSATIAIVGGSITIHDATWSAGYGGVGSATATETAFPNAFQGVAEATEQNPKNYNCNAKSYPINVINTVGHFKGYCSQSSPYVV